MYNMFADEEVLVAKTEMTVQMLEKEGAVYVHSITVLSSCYVRTQIP